MADSSTSQARISFAGFICSWKIPHKTGESKRERFFSVYDELKKNVEQSAIQSGEAGGKWKQVRISEPGRHFWGFARRQQ